MCYRYRYLLLRSAFFQRRLRWTEFLRVIESSGSGFDLRHAVRIVRVAAANPNPNPNPCTNPSSKSTAVAAAAATAISAGSGDISDLPLLLCVDELIRASRDNRPQVFCAILTEMMSCDRRFEVLVSTLRPTPSSSAWDLTGSGRRIEWLFLPPLTPAAAHKLLSRRKLEGSLALELLISDCGGHPRWIEALDTTLQQVRSAGFVVCVCLLTIS